MFAPIPGGTDADEGVGRNVKDGGHEGVGETVVANHAQGERRKQRREVHIDRRKSEIDVFEHLAGGLHIERIHAASDDRAARRRRRNKGD